MMSQNKILIGIIALIFGALGVWFGLERMKSAAPPPLEKAANAANVASIEKATNASASAPSTPNPNDPAAALFASQLMDKSGQMQAMSQWKGKPLIINFWASWCVPCVKEMPELAQLQKELSPKGIELIGIGIDSPDKIREFASEHNISYPLLIAGMEGTELSRQLGNQTGGLPFTILIGADGKVKKTYLGLLKFQQLRNDIAQVFK
jgi:thiol-disulfide isomerase/thioredoxin